MKAPLGTYAVLGNNDYEACYDDILKEMERQGIHLLEHKADTLKRNGERIVIAGVRNPFNLERNGQSPTLSLSPDDFDLVLAGHTHGGQVTLFGLYAPVVPSRYGQRFLKRIKTNSEKQPVIITNGIGTSSKNLRLFAPSEVVVLTLRKL